ncbi:MAG: hypothetical protein ACTSRG_20205 [Candidatus Helarchaeota archaeon]
MTYISVFEQDNNNGINLKIECNECDQSLRVCAIQRKKISRDMEFVSMSYYCHRCNLTYLIFKTIQKHIKRKL